jgi:dihydroorotate dehydrogenase
MYRRIIRPILFKFSPESIHDFIFSFLKIALNIPGISFLTKKYFEVNDPLLKRNVFGLEFKNPVGLAAGFDKDAKLFNELSSFGFGFIEIGTLTPLAQPGNPQPRSFRLPKDKALINRMGFNNNGLEEAVERLKKNHSGILIGGNIGKNKITPNDEAIGDYEEGFLSLFDVVDYFVVNVSSPNTPNLRALQEKEPLLNLLSHLMTLNLKKKNNKKPILLKIAPDLSNEQLDDIIDIVIQSKIDGVIATNTTISREGLITKKEKVEQLGAGGLSGAPLRSRSTEVIRYLKEKSNAAFPVIGVGGIMSVQDAIEKLEAGADLLQIYTGFIYEGPGLIKKINKELIRKGL